MPQALALPLVDRNPIWERTCGSQLTPLLSLIRGALVDGFSRQWRGYLSIDKTRIRVLKFFLAAAVDGGRVAQRQSSRLITGWLGVRIPPRPPKLRCR